MEKFAEILGKALSGALDGEPQSRKEKGSGPEGGGDEEKVWKTILGQSKFNQLSKEKAAGKTDPEWALEEEERIKSQQKVRKFAEPGNKYECLYNDCIARETRVRLKLGEGRGKESVGEPAVSHASFFSTVAWPLLAYLNQLKAGTVINCSRLGRFVCGRTQACTDNDYC